MHFRSFDHVNDLMVNLGYQMVEDYHCYSFSDCWATHFQKQRKARLKQMSQANGQNPAGSRCQIYLVLCVGHKGFECFPVLHIPGESPFKCALADSVSQRS